MIGDASGLVRAFKGKGVTTAVLTGVRAAETILKYGYSKQTFQDHYRSANQDIVQDLPYGRAMRILTIFMSRTKLMDPVLRAAQSTPELQAALFDAVSAHALYREVFAKILRPKPVWAVLKALVSGQSG
jgi:flavin-dependent dehydrogenase